MSRKPLWLTCLESRLAPATFTVLNLNNSGPGSLRQAVANANALAGPDDIAFAVEGTIALTGVDELNITDAVKVTGPGASKLVVQGSSFGEVFRLIDAPASTSVVLQGLTIAESPSLMNDPAIAFNNQSLTIRNCTITGCSSLGNGGAVRGGSFAGALLIEDSTLTGNLSMGHGGAIYGGAATVTIRRSTISGNTIRNTSTGIPVSGGGIHAARLFLEDSTVANNLVDQSSYGGRSFGAGIRLAKGSQATIANSTISGNSTNTAFSTQGISISSGSTVLIRNSTISGNNAQPLSDEGGGITITGDVVTGSVTIQNCTITGNQGGGIGDFANDISAVNLTIDSTIIAGNTQGAVPSGIQDLTFTFAPITVNGGNNLIGILDSTSKATLTGGGNLIGTVGSPLNPNLELLADNGGFTSTHALKSASIAINNGNNVAGLFFDQRGFTRTSGTADIGAYELVTGQIVTTADDAGPGSLRQAIADSPVGGSISFSPLFLTPQVITLTSGHLVVPRAMSIVGPGPANLTITQTGTTRLMHTGAAPIQAIIGISGLTFTGGKAPAGSPQGGAFYSENEAVTLSDCVFTNNSAASSGGGLYFEGTRNRITILRCKITGNTAGTSSGGGVAVNNVSFPGSPGYLPSLIHFRDTLISGNTAGGTFGGGGVFARFGTTIIENCTIINNKSTVDGGGLSLDSNGPAVTVRNSTIAGNSAGKSGGGILVAGSGATVSLQNCTITANTANTGSGGGFARSSGTNTLNIANTIISGNTNAATPDIASTGTVNVNASAIGSAIGFTLTGADNLAFGANLHLGPLADNGGPTPTIALLPFSPAIHKGVAAGAPTFDQRGFARFGTADIGAFEFQPARVTAIELNTLTIDDNNVGSGKFTVTATFNSVMDTAIQPVLSFPVEPVFGTLSYASGTWTDSTHWVAKYDVADAGVTLANIDIRIADGKDVAGYPMATFNAVDAFHIDTQNPVIASITTTTPNGTYGPGSAIPITLNFSEPVNLDGTLNLTLDTGAKLSIIGPASGTSFSATYTVTAGQSSPDLNVTAIALGLGDDIRDFAGNDCALALPGSNLAQNAAIVIAPSVGVTGFTVNNGQLQRSRVTTLAVTLSASVPLVNLGTITVTRGGNPFTVNTGNGLQLALVGTLLTATFANVDNEGLDFGSLSDGRWRLNISAFLYQSPEFFRLFGDADANSTVNALDFALFGNDFGSVSPGIAFDFDNNGTINAADFAEFGNRFGVTL